MAIYAHVYQRECKTLAVKNDAQPPRGFTDRCDTRNNPQDGCHGWFQTCQGRCQVQRKLKILKWNLD